MKKNAILFLVLIFSSLNFVYAQGDYNRGYLSIGYNNISMKNINTAMTENGLVGLPNSNFYVGFGGNRNFGRWLIGGEGGYLVGRKSTNTQYEEITRGGQGYIYGGYNIVNNETFYLAPILGLGAGGKVILVDSKTQTTLATYLRNNYAKKLENGGFIVHTALRAGISVSEGFEIDIDAGYNVGANKEWKARGSTLTENQKDKMGGFFTMVNLVWKMRQN